MNLRRFTNKDQLDLKKVYFDSIKNIDLKIYNEEQKKAWSSQAWDNPNFEKSITKGKVWVIENENIVAFASRYPDNKISLLYCKGNYQRRGYGSMLIIKLEEEAREEGFRDISTEASLLSYKLFLRHNWEIIRKEKIIINNKCFERYKMSKNL